MEHEMEVEIFRAGDYGPRGRYSEADLETLATDYDPAVHEAPVTVDHLQEGPALGWVRGLRRAGKVLMARLGGLQAEFLDRMRSGGFKKRSIELYRRLETTGRPYLRALTFLGAGAPVVKGLADPVFAEDAAEPVAILFEETKETPVAEHETREPHVPETAPDPVFAETHEDPDLTPLTPEVDAEIQSFCEQMRSEGRLLPLWEEAGLAPFLAALENSRPLRFSDDPANAPLTLRAWFERFLAHLAPSVPMGELTGAVPALHRSVSRPVDLPSNWRGVRVDTASMNLHERACRYRESNPDVAYAEALRAVCS
ncbi:hypothetical protein HQ520_02165 [bacterium]|nr:hypothetical protein [bacterium]